MAAPIVAFIGAAVASGIGHFIGSKVNNSLSSITDPWMLPLKYAGNNIARTEITGPDLATRAWLDGLFTDDGYASLMGFHNINLDENRGLQFNKDSARIWKKALQANYYKLSLAEILAAIYQGIITKDEGVKLIGNHKVKRDHWKAMNDFIYGKFNIEPIIALYNRGDFDKQRAIKEVRRTAQINEDDAKQLLKLSTMIPGPSDLVRFAVRDVWNENIVKDFGLDEEYDQNGDMRKWLAAQGIGDVTIKDSNGNIITADMAKLYWMAHWQTMSPTQGYQAKFRLRPDRLAKWGEGIANLEPFAQKQLEDLLKRSDYTPKERKWLSAISQRTLQFRQAKQLYDNEIIDKKEMYETMLDFGYVKEDANHLSDMYEKLKQDAEDKKDKQENDRRYGAFRRSILSSYREGSTNEMLAFNSLVSTGMDSEDANVAMRAIDIDVNRRLVKQYVKMVHDEFFIGGMTAEEAVAGLISGGLSTERSHQYVILWQRQLNRPRRTTSANKLLEWYQHGYLSDLELSRRLAILGFSNSDILIYNAEASRMLSENLARIEAARARTIRQQIEATQRLQRQAEARIRTSQAHFRTYSGLTQMRKWFIDNEITEQDVRSRMAFLGIPIEDIDRYILDWSRDRGGNNG